MRLDRLFIKAYGRKVVCVFPAILLGSLLFVAVWQTIARSEGNLSSFVVYTNEDDMQADVGFIADAGNSIVQADFKSAHNNPDGSIDLVFKLYRKAKPSAALSQQGQRDSKVNNTSKNVTNATGNGTTPTPPLTRTAYPLTLNSELLINPLTLCPVGTPVDYLIIVHSAIAYFQRRREIRETYGGRGVFGNITQRVVFMLGTTSDPVATRSIQKEALQHGDIVQGRFQDSYHNLTHKAVMDFRWAASHCPQARLVVKIDDDVFINIFKLVEEILPVYSNRKRHIACHLRKAGTSPIQRGKGRWLVGQDEFKDQKTYPYDYCNGFFVILTSDLIQPLLKAAWLNPFFWIDDVYAFGALPATVGNVTFVDFSEILTVRHSKGMSCVERKGINCEFLAVSQYIEGGIESLWYSIIANISDAAVRKFKLFNTP